MLARFFIAAALFLGLDFLQLGKFGGTACLGRAERLCRRFDNRLGSRGLGGIRSRAFCNSVNRCLGSIVSWRVGLRFLHAFLKSANTSRTLLCGKPVLGTCFGSGGRGCLGRCLRRRCNRFGLLGRSTMRRGRRALAAHLDLHGTSAGAAGCRPQLAGLETAECQPAARQAELLGFATIVAHHEPFPGNRRKPPDCQCAQGDTPVSPSLTRRRPRKGLQSQQFPAQIFRRFRNPAPPHRGKGQTVTSKHTAKLGRIQLPTCPVNIETACQPPHFAIRGVWRCQQPGKALAFGRQLAGTTDKITCAPGQTGSRQCTLPQHLRDLKNIFFNLAEAGADAPRQEVP